MNFSVHIPGMGHARWECTYLYTVTSIIWFSPEWLPYILGECQLKPPPLTPNLVLSLTFSFASSGPQPRHGFEEERGLCLLPFDSQGTWALSTRTTTWYTSSLPCGPRLILCKQDEVRANYAWAWNLEAQSWKRRDLCAGECEGGRILKGWGSADRAPSQWPSRRTRVPSPNGNKRSRGWEDFLQGAVGLCPFHYLSTCS